MAWTMVAAGYWQKGDWKMTRDSEGFWDVMEGTRFRGTFRSMKNARIFVAMQEANK